MADTFEHNRLTELNEKELQQVEGGMCALIIYGAVIVIALLLVTC